MLKIELGSGQYILDVVENTLVVRDTSESHEVGSVATLEDIKDSEKKLKITFNNRESALTLCKQIIKIAEKLV